jgi:hypothetical protein
VKLVRRWSSHAKDRVTFVRWMIYWIDQIFEVSYKVPVYYPGPREDHGNLQGAAYADQGDGREKGFEVLQGIVDCLWL